MRRSAGIALVALAATLWGLDQWIRGPLSATTTAATIVFGEHLVLVAADAAARGRRACGCVQARLASRPRGGRDRRRCLGGRHDPVHRSALHAPRLRDARRLAEGAAGLRGPRRDGCPRRAAAPTLRRLLRRRARGNLAHGRAASAASGSARTRDDVVCARRRAPLGARHRVRPLPRPRHAVRARGDPAGSSSACRRARSPCSCSSAPAFASWHDTFWIARARARHRVRGDVPLLLRPSLDAGGRGDDRGARVPRHRDPRRLFQVRPGADAAGSGSASRSRASSSRSCPRVHRMRECRCPPRCRREAEPSSARRRARVVAARRRRRRPLAAARSRPRGRRRDRRRRLHRVSGPRWRCARSPSRRASRCSRPSSAAGGRAAGTAASATGTGRTCRRFATSSATRRRSGSAPPATGSCPGIRAFLAERGEDAWLREDGLLEVSTAPSQDGEIDGQVDAAREVGHPEEAELRESPGISPRFRRGVFFRDGATVHPARLVRALRRAALADGVELYEGTRAQLRADGTVDANGRTVRARDVVVATNAAATEWRPVRGRLTVFGSYVVLTEPVPDLLERDRLDGRPGDLRRAHVPPLLPHDERRPRADGLRLRADRLWGAHRPPLHPRRGHRRAGRGRASPPPPGARRRACRGGVGRADRRLGRPRAVHRHRSVDADPLRARLLRPRRRPVVARGSCARIAASPASTTSGRDCRSSTGASRACRREPIRRIGGGAIRAAILALEEAEEHGRRASPAARAVRCGSAPARNEARAALAARISPTARSVR